MGGLVEQNTPFFTVKTLIARLLELDSCKNIHEREQLILQHITDDEMRKFLPLLNDILVLKVTRQYAVYHAQSRIMNFTCKDQTAVKLHCLHNLVCTYHLQRFGNWICKYSLASNWFRSCVFHFSCLLSRSNPHSQFPQTHTTVHMNNAERTKALHKLLFDIVHQVYHCVPHLHRNLLYPRDHK